MPAYYYKCPECGTDMVKEMSIKTYQYSSAQSCPNCSATMNRNYTGVNSSVVGTRKPKSSDIFKKDTP